ncbi:MAG: hypothetical protein LBR85_03480 [Oscillospiraceae bacterium]|jgi:hypothetical protein|nr:hypothetical protein [Oscillospiraceae bacterium]
MTFKAALNSRIPTDGPSEAALRRALNAAQTNTRRTALTARLAITAASFVCLAAAVVAVFALRGAPSIQPPAVNLPATPAPSPTATTESNRDKVIFDTYMGTNREETEKIAALAEDIFSSAIFRGAAVEGERLAVSLDVSAVNMEHPIHETYPSAAAKIFLLSDIREVFFDCAGDSSETFIYQDFVDLYNENFDSWKLLAEDAALSFDDYTEIVAVYESAYKKQLEKAEEAEAALMEEIERLLEERAALLERLRSSRLLGVCTAELDSDDALETVEFYAVTQNPDTASTTKHPVLSTEINGNYREYAFTDYVGEINEAELFPIRGAGGIWIVAAIQDDTNKWKIYVMGVEITDDNGGAWHVIAELETEASTDSKAFPYDEETLLGLIYAARPA